MLNFSDLVGEHVFEIVPKMDARHPTDPDASGVIFGLSGTTYLVFEDPSDGYRSSAGPILSFEGAAYELSGEGCETYLREKVVCSHRTQGAYSGSTDDVLEVRNAATGHLIFEVGTEDVDDYYPGYVCRWHPEHLSANQERS